MRLMFAFVGIAPAEGLMCITLRFITVVAGAAAMLPLLVEPTPLTLWFAPL